MLAELNPDKTTVHFLLRNYHLLTTVHTPLIQN